MHLKHKQTSRKKHKRSTKNSEKKLQTTQKHIEFTVEQTKNLNTNEKQVVAALLFKLLRNAANKYHTGMDRMLAGF